MWSWFQQSVWILPLTVSLSTGATSICRYTRWLGFTTWAFISRYAWVGRQRSRKRFHIHGKRQSSWRKTAFWFTSDYHQQKGNNLISTMITQSFSWEVKIFMCSSLLARQSSFSQTPASMQNVQQLCRTITCPSFVWQPPNCPLCQHSQATLVLARRWASWNQRGCVSVCPKEDCTCCCCSLWCQGWLKNVCSVAEEQASSCNWEKKSIPKTTLSFMCLLSGEQHSCNLVLCPSHIQRASRSRLQDNRVQGAHFSDKAASTLSYTRGWRDFVSWPLPRIPLASFISARIDALKAVMSLAPTNCPKITPSYLAL